MTGEQAAQLQRSFILAESDQSLHSLQFGLRPVWGSRHWCQAVRNDPGVAMG